MKNLIQWIKNKSKYFKLIFVISVCVLVINEITVLLKTLSYQQLETILTNLPLTHILAMFVIGLVAVTPMLLYDFVLTDMLPNKFSRTYIIKTSWIINTLNNICGFGGLISIGLRSQLYGKKASKKQNLQSLSSILVFLLAGLSICCLLSLVVFLVWGVDPYQQQYIIWLVGGALYFPLVFGFTYLQKHNLFATLTAKRKTTLILASFLEWIGVLTCFLFIGFLMGLKFDPLRLMPLYIAASVIGMVSMLPGALGSFDIIMILSLSSMGIGKETAVAWLLLYRLFYYFIPFLIGLVLLVHDMGGTINDQFKGIPKELLIKGSHQLLVLALYFSGIMLVLSATIPRAFQQFSWLNRMNPLSFHFISQMPCILLGFLLLAMGRGVAAKIQKIYVPTLLVLGLTVGYTFWKDFSWGIILFLAILFVFMACSRSELYRTQFVFSWEMLFKDGLLYAVLTLLYIVIGVYNLPHIHHKRKIVEFLLFPSEKLWFSGLIAIFIVSVCYFILIRYVTRSSTQIGEDFDYARVVMILSRYGGNENSHLVFLHDKRLFFYQNEQGEDVAFFQFQIKANKCIVMGEPSGDEQEILAATQAFIKAADSLNYELVFYEIKESYTMLLHELGFDFLKVGEEGYVDLQNFAITGKKFKGERALMNKFEREGYTWKMVNPPYTSELLNELAKISNEWLGTRKEKGFSMGYFSVDYLAQAPLVIVADSTGKVVAFANIMPFYNSEKISIDLMRHSTSAPSGIMDFLFISLFNYSQQENYQYFNLGMAPLSNVGYSQKSFLQERLAYFIYELGTRFYSFQGLRRYKEKYVSSWIPKYTAYPKECSLICTILQLLIIVNEPIEVKD